MLKSYLLVACRNIWRNKSYTFLNLFGLVLGLASCIIIVLYVQDELGYDRFHADADTMYRVNWDYSWNDAEGIGPGTPPPLARTFTQELPEVLTATRLFSVSRTVVRHEDTFFNEDRIVAADTNFFSFFDFTLLEGNPTTVLSSPNSIVLTETMARKYFGEEQAVGNTLLVGAESNVFGVPYRPEFQVSGIVADPPTHSHIQFDFITSIDSHPEVAYFDWSWVWMQMTTYVQLVDGVSLETLTPRVQDLVGRHAPGAFDRIGFSYDDLLTGGGRWDFTFQPMTDIYLGSASIGNRLGPVGNRSYIWLFSTIAILVLLVAGINYTNLSMARSAIRAREVSVRKALGARRNGLVGQFMTESLVLSLMALPLALLLVLVSLQPLNALAGMSLSFSLSPAFILALVGLLALVGFGAGAYPGVYLSSLRPIQALKGTFKTGRRSRWFRDALVVGQFVASIALIACTLGVQKQLHFIQQSDMGFDREHVLVISNENHPLGNQVDAFKEQIEQHYGILQASVSTGIPSQFGFQDYYKVEGHGDELFDLISYTVDEAYTDVLGLNVIEGRGFSEDRVADAGSVLLNQTAVQTFGLEDPIGATIAYPGTSGVGQYEVIGVVEDFNFLALRNPIVPFALFHQESASYEISDSYVVVRLTAGSELEETIQYLENQWEAFAPEIPFDYSFLDERLEADYRSDQIMRNVFTLFALITILVACLGLIGLAAYAAERRTKEIGVRKVMGADVPHLVGLLIRNFVQLVAVAFVLAIPITYLVLQHWLEEFAYRTSIGPGIFLLSGGMILCIALLTVSIQSLKAALADPIKSLRYE